MLTIRHQGVRLCDGLTRRDVLRVGGLGALGLSLPELLRARQHAVAGSPASPGGGKAKACILLFLMGGPPQHSTWDPKPDAPPEIRGEFKPIATATQGLQVGELMPLTARNTQKICVLRAMSSDDNAHSSSGYYMMTGEPHKPKNSENANPGPPNDYPSMGGVLRRLRGDNQGVPSAITLPMRIFNTDGSVWPGQNAGFLGRIADPWLFTFDPSTASPRMGDFALPDDLPASRLAGRQSLLHLMNQYLDGVDRSGRMSAFDQQSQQAFDMLRSTQSRVAFRLDQEPDKVRDRYGRTPFGQSVLLARRLIEAGVTLVQVNWYRGPGEPSDAPVWDTHVKETERLKTVLMPPMDQAYSALLEDLFQRGLLDTTLVVWMGEFGRTPKFNGRAGRDHWGHVYSVALAGGGVRGGQVLGASDKSAAYPKDGRVEPQDLTATIFHCLGYHADTQIHDTLNRPLPISRGEVIRGVV